jgi:hypothetical protein
MTKQLNLQLTDEEYAQIVELRKQHPDLPTVQGMARALFRYALATNSVTKGALRLSIGRKHAAHQ